MNCSEHVEKLNSILNTHFHWNKARITCFSKMLVGLFMTRTVNLTEIAMVFEGKVKFLSKYRRLQRFFAKFEVDYKVVAEFMFNLFGFRNKKVYLSMDRTNWKWGRTDINILMLAVIYKGTAIPLIWAMVNGPGNSATKQRIMMIKTFISWFGKDCIKGLLCDREFIGKVWFAWLLKEKIPFCIRIKENTVLSNNGIALKYAFKMTKVHERETLRGGRIWGHNVFLSITRDIKGKLVIIASDQEVDGLEIYCRRWGIETLFGCLKSRGFNFEDTHITDKNRIKKMIFLLAISFSWAHRTGEWRHEKLEPITIRKHGRPSYSFFRYGLDYIRSFFFRVSSISFLTLTEFLVIIPVKLKKEQDNGNETGRRRSSV